MATYITLIQWTQQGIEKIRESPARVDSVKKVFNELGGQVKAFYLVMGQYDGVLISEAPNDEAVAKAMLSICSRGNARTQTLRAFPEDEYRKIIAALP